MVFHWSLSDTKSPHVFRTLLSIIADLNNAIVWIVCTCPLISMSSSPFVNALANVPRAQITIYHFHVPQFFHFSSKVQVLVFLFTFFQFYSVASQDSKVYNSASSLFSSTITRSGHLAKIMWLVCISKSQRSLCVSFSRTDSGLCVYHLFERSNLNFLHNS